MNKGKSLSDLRDHLFDAIERVKSLNDQNTDENEKMTLEQAQTICDLSGQIIESAKVEVQGMAIIAKCENPKFLISSIENSDMMIKPKLTE